MNLCHLLDTIPSVPLFLMNKRPSFSLVLLAKLQRNEDCNVLLGAVVEMEQSVHECFLGNATFPC